MYCFYILETEPHKFQTYYKNIENAQKALWEYYLSHGGSKDDMDTQTENKFYLETVGVIHNYGTIYEEYFEDVE